MALPAARAYAAKKTLESKEEALHSILGQNNDERRPRATGCVFSGMIANSPGLDDFENARTTAPVKPHRQKKNPVASRTKR